MRLGLFARLSIAMTAVCLANGGASGASLRSELAGLLLDHPQIRGANKTLEAAGKEVGKANANFFPTVSFTAEAGHELIDSPAVRSTYADNEGKISSRSPQTANITVTQNLFNGFLTHSQVRTARLNKEISTISLESTKQNTLFDGITAYINVLRQRRLVELSTENEATIQHQLNLEDERVQRGSGVAVDVLQAKSRLQVSKERRVNFEGDFQNAVSAYSKMFNHLPDVDSMMDPVPPIEMIPSTLERAIEIATTGNPLVNNANASVEVARENRRSVLAELAPTLDMEGQFNYEKHSNTTLGTRRDYSVLLRASWDMFSGFSTRDSLSQANYEYRATQDTREDTSRRIIEQTKVTWQALLTARARLELLENAVNIASEVFASRKRLREAGKETVISVLDAENEVSNAQINFTSASYDERLAVFQLLLSMGQLNAKSLAVTVP